MPHIRILDDVIGIATTYYYGLESLDAKVS